MKKLIFILFIGVALISFNHSFLLGLAGGFSDEKEPASQKALSMDNRSYAYGRAMAAFWPSGCELYDANRPLISKHSSYAQFWVSWNAVEPQQKNTDYENHMSGQLQAINHAVNLCVERGVKVEFVMWHTPH